MTRYHLIVCLPLLAAIVAGLFGRRIGDAAAMAVTCGAVIIGAVLSWVAFYLVIGHEQVVTVKVLDWIYSGGFQVDWALQIDQLTAVMLVSSAESRVGKEGVRTCSFRWSPNH